MPAPDPTETDEFKRWFGKSKAVHEITGKPRLVYHGTDESFTAFDRSKISDHQDEGGFFFSPDKFRTEPYGPVAMPVYLKIENQYRTFPMAWMAREHFNQDGTLGPIPSNEELRKQGYDGVIIEGDPSSADEPTWEFGNDVYIAFYPEQIKSAKNTGAFDPENPDIYDLPSPEAVLRAERAVMAIESIPQAKAAKHAP